MPVFSLRFCCWILSFFCSACWVKIVALNVYVCGVRLREEGWILTHLGDLTKLKKYEINSLFKSFSFPLYMYNYIAKAKTVKRFCWSILSLTWSRKHNLQRLPLTWSRKHNLQRLPLTWSRKHNLQQLPLTSSRKHNLQRLPLTWSRKHNLQRLPLTWSRKHNLQRLPLTSGPGNTTFKGYLCLISDK